MSERVFCPYCMKVTMCKCRKLLDCWEYTCEECGKVAELDMDETERDYNDEAARAAGGEGDE